MFNLSKNPAEDYLKLVEVFDPGSAHELIKRLWINFVSLPALDALDIYAYGGQANLWGHQTDFSPKKYWTGIIKLVQQTVGRRDRISYILQQLRGTLDMFNCYPNIPKAGSINTARETTPIENKYFKKFQERPMAILDEDIPGWSNFGLNVRHFLSTAQTNRYQSVLDLRWEDQHPKLLLQQLEAAEQEDIANVGLGEEPGLPGRTIVKSGEYHWVLLSLGYCPIEGRIMGHCGNLAGQDDPTQRILSLRDAQEIPHLTFILHTVQKTSSGQPIGYLGEMKGRKNNKPPAKYHSQIVDLLRSPLIQFVRGGGYKPEANFSLQDLSPDVREALQKEKPQLFSLKECINKNGLDYLWRTVDWNPGGIPKEEERLGLPKDQIIVGRFDLEDLFETICELDGGSQIGPRLRNQITDLIKVYQEGHVDYDMRRKDFTSESDMIGLLPTHLQAQICSDHNSKEDLEECIKEEYGDWLFEAYVNGWESGTFGNIMTTVEKLVANPFASGAVGKMEDESTVIYILSVDELITQADLFIKSPPGYFSTLTDFLFGRIREGYNPRRIIPHDYDKYDEEAAKEYLMDNLPSELSKKSQRNPADNDLRYLQRSVNADIKNLAAWEHLLATAHRMGLWVNISSLPGRALARAYDVKLSFGIPGHSRGIPVFGYRETPQEPLPTTVGVGLFFELFPQGSVVSIGSPYEATQRNPSQSLLQAVQNKLAQWKPKFPGYNEWITGEEGQIYIRYYGYQNKVYLDLATFEIDPRYQKQGISKSIIDWACSTQADVVKIENIQNVGWREKLKTYSYPGRTTKITYDLGGTMTIFFIKEVPQKRLANPAKQLAKLRCQQYNYIFTDKHFIDFLPPAKAGGFPLSSLSFYSLR